MNKITPVTRRHILEGIASENWFGKLSELDFLDRIFNLHQLPTSDTRFSDMYGDVMQHRVNNDDYENTWFITDQRLDILNVPDDKFMLFITQMMHPEIIDPANRDMFFKLCNNYLINDGYQLVPDKIISGEPAYIIREVSHTDVIRNWLLRLEDGCKAISTNGTFSDSDYNTIKQVLRKEHTLYQLLPQYIRTYNQTIQIRQWMQERSSHYADRREIITKDFAPAFQFLDNINQNVDPSSDTLVPFQDWDIIGQGGFGIVYKVKHKFIDRFFAIKVFSPSPFSIGKHDRERFFKEAQILFSLDHPNIIKIYDVGMLAEKPFIKMEFFVGANLNNILCKCGRLQPVKALELVHAVASGLRYAFNKSHIVHRDLKPSNILAARPSLIKVIDFGLGVYVEDDLSSRLTKTGEQVASSAYTSPWLLANPKLIDPVCDIYSLGAVWYECLLGRVPQGAGIESNLEAENAIPQQHKDMIIRCLQTDRNLCFKSWNDFYSCLEKL